jgi:hypothetical protein
MHVTGTHNLFSNNIVYGNIAGGIGGTLQNYAHHDVLCIGGTPISGTDADGTAGGCPSTNPKSDPSITSTFTNYQLDTNTAPASNYNPANYQLKSGSNAINNGTTACAASPDLNPCTPTTDFNGTARSGIMDIGAYNF